eukprot:1127156-Pyramimonas_sp.AAC.1
MNIKVFGLLRVLFGALLCDLEPWENQLGPCWAVLGRLGGLRPSWGRLGALGGLLGVSWGSLRATWHTLNAILDS